MISGGMETRHEVIRLVAALNIRDITSFTRTMSEFDNEITMQNGWILKWFQKRCSLLAVHPESRSSYNVCFFPDCTNEIRPGNFCEHVVEPASQAYTQSTPSFKTIIHEAMKISGIHERDSIFAYNLLINTLKERPNNCIHVPKHKVDVKLDKCGSTLIVQDGDKLTRICGLPGCFMQTLENYRDIIPRYCFIHQGIGFKQTTSARRWKDMAPLFKLVVVDAATRLKENVNSNNVSGWTKLLSEFVQFDEDSSFYIPYWIPGQNRQSVIEVEFGVNGSLEFIYENERIGICNQPFCCTETANIRRLKVELDFKDPSIFRCTNHQQKFVLKGDDFLKIYQQSAAKLADQLK